MAVHGKRRTAHRIWYIFLFSCRSACDADAPFQFIRWAVVELLGCVLDAGSVVLSSSLVWSLQMPLKRKLAVSAIFATRLL